MALPVRLPKKKYAAAKKTSSPPYKRSMLYDVPGLVRVRVQLPRASDYEIGAHKLVEVKFKELTLRIELVRIAGGWDVVPR